MTTAQGLGWGPGWPHAQTNKIVPLEVGGVSFLGGVRREAHELFVLLLEETELRGYRLHIGWCWGFANRAIKVWRDGKLVIPEAGDPDARPSNHSWGIAVDINAPTNPYIGSGSMRTDMPTWMPRLWRRYGFHWGGWGWGGTARDPMHYELVLTPEATKAMIAKARREIGRPTYVFKGRRYREVRRLLAAMRSRLRGLGGTVHVQLER